MNDILKNILSRRSCRNFTDEKVKDADLESILQAGIYAPSGMNRQSWQFTAVQNKEIIRQLEEVIKGQLKLEKYNMYGASTIILLSNDRDNSNGLADCACAMENIFLMANSLGIGSCWINQLKTICDVSEVRNVLDKLDIPKNHIVWGTAALGYVKVMPNAKVKNEEVIKYFR